jgi:hypothetical protein
MGHTSGRRHQSALFAEQSLILYLQDRQRDEDSRRKCGTLDAQHAQTEQEYEEGTQNEACRTERSRRRRQEPNQGRRQAQAVSSTSPRLKVGLGLRCLRCSAIIEASKKRKSKGVDTKKSGVSKEADSQLQVDLDE